MRFRSVLTAFTVAALAMTTAPAHAEDVDFGDPIVDQRYNDGEVGFVTLAFGPSTTARTGNGRPMDAHCRFVIEASVDSVITLQIVAEAHAGSTVEDGEPITPAGTGVRCRVRLGNGTTVEVQAAGPGATAVARGRFSFSNFQSPVTLCSRPNVLWSDNLHQISSTEFCQTS